MMTSRQRLLTALRRGQPDRVPVTLFDLDPHLGITWRAQDPTYDRVRQAARDLQDSVHFAPYRPGLFYTAEGTFPVETRAWTEGGATYTETTVQTPRGRLLRSVARQEPGLRTSWHPKAFLEDEDDVEAFLSLPIEPSRPDLARVEQVERDLGERGVVMFSLDDPVGAVEPLLPFETYAAWSATARGRATIHRLLDAMHARLRGMVEHLAARSRDRIFRFCGPELAGPTLLPPARFAEFVVPYLADLVQLVKRSGNVALIHCHGRLDAILELIAGLEPDALEPVECRPSAQGDVTLADVKRRIGARVCLMGNVQNGDLETETPDGLERKARQAIEEGAPGGGFILMPTATLYRSLSPRMEENILRFLEAGRRYGAYPARVRT